MSVQPKVATYNRDDEKADDSRPSNTWPETPQQLSNFLDEHLDHLVRYAFRRLRNIHDAQDIVQEVLVKVFAKPKPGLNAIAYLFRSVDNAGIDFLRKRGCTSVPLDGDEAAAAAVSERRNPLEEAMVAEEMSRAEELLSRLPAEQAESIRLRVFDGLRLEEIAVILGCPIDTVSSRLRYGFAKLREMVSRSRSKDL
ncbi:MAG TPA: RNA polymerase sigma factor [Acidobacteriota bacterium]|nr:RNA polymerase sigma factor [Acidobacteriota bacterium]